MSRLRRAARLAYLLAQHPLHLHRGLVRRGLTLGWIDAVRPYLNAPGVKPVGLPVDEYSSYQAVRYILAREFRQAHPTGEPWEHDYNPILSHLWRREMHPLRWLPAAWHLRNCRTVLEYGCGVAPYAHGVTTAWPFAQQLVVTDLEGPFLNYCRWWFRGDSRVTVLSVDMVMPEDHRAPEIRGRFDGIVCTEVFEHLADPVKVAEWMTRNAGVVCFDYVDDHSDARRATLRLFASHGYFRGPDARGLYVWRRTSC